MLSKERQGEIALIYLKDKMRREGIKLSSSSRRDIGDTAKKLNIPVEEATEFAEILVREIVEETFPKKQ